MELSIYQVDAFTSKAFTGNPAGVCITNESLSDDLMLSIAREMAVSETAFLSLEDMTLRWFTPEVEVALCGHGTLSVAHILVETGQAKVDEVITFNTLSGVLTAKVTPTDIQLILPTAQLTAAQAIDDQLLKALGLRDDQIVSLASFDSKQLIEVADEQVVINLSPDFNAMKKLEGRGVVVTSISSKPNLDFMSRYFAPWVGINEDPVTGSNHCALSLFWSEKLDKTELKAYQASARGGYIGMKLMPDNQTTLIGKALTTIKGVMLV
ncbi:phenazine biosynthesis protein PhzF [Vibrio inusitatus NBRC 102082]|uniref:Phenazine biosynthesis protein PhzF n=1 Tax=Vibrio inusitatus NBRC 102082 TaxID=1219070 RepID=A0A4Y3HTK7_9VIBR|nr:PhzF family phenazine biosynthesis protein [Vibrio inusitatus]GEA49634.1 phenazine biosynthesis protein PhzF [Vibrio inusitatus NBRC 102082]